MSSKRGRMSRKRPTQVEQERQISDLKRRVQQLEKRLKQALKQLRNHEDIDLDLKVAMDLEEEAGFDDMMAGRPAEEDNDYITVTLANGNVKRIRKRAV